MRGRPRPAGNPAPDGPSQALTHSPDSGSAADTDEKKAEEKWKCPDLFGHVAADVDGCRRESESTSQALPPGPARARPTSRESPG